MQSFAQVAIQNNLLATAGDSQSNASVQVDYSLGEVFTAMIDDGSTVLTQGFHQPITRRIYPAANDPDITINVAEGDMESISIYPNPTQDYIVIKTPYQQGLSVELIDMTGRLVMTYDLNQTSNTLDLRSFEDGTYQLIIKTDQGQLSRIPVIKVK